METDKKPSLVGTAATKHSWPSPQDYNEAIQNLSTAFADPELQAGEPELDAVGIPRPVSGAFASVYKVQSGTKTFAVRCFLHNIRDSEQRYQLISDFVMNDELPYTVSFEYQARGVLIRGDWYPILKMDWVQGQTLDSFIQSNLHEKDRLTRVLQQFEVMCSDLGKAGIAHGDLQHGNIMVTDEGELRLVDYDGMFVPGMKGWKSNELGHRNYQHPKRQAQHFGPYLDTFAKWSIFVSLRALIEQPSFYRKCKAGGDCLLFRREDYINPEQSNSLKHLLHEGSPQLVHSVKCLLWLALAEPQSILALNQQIDDSQLPSLNYPALTESATETHEEKVSRWWNHFLSEQSKTGLSLADREILSLPLRHVVFRHDEDLTVYLTNPAEAKKPIDYVALLAACVGFALVGTVLNPAFGIGCFVVGLFTIASLEHRQTVYGQNSPELVSRGIATDGVVTEKMVTTEEDGFTHRHLIRYEYDVALEHGGTSRRAGRYSIHQSDWKNITPGTELTILYFEDDTWLSVPYELCRYKARVPE